MLSYHIQQVEDMQTQDGTSFGDDFHGAKVIEAAKAYAALKSESAVARVPINTHINRPQDMGPGRLQLFREEDGDMCIAVVDSRGTYAGIQFCTSIVGGGRSPRTLAALYELATAMEADNQENPLPSGFNADGS